VRRERIATAWPPSSASPSILIAAGGQAVLQAEIEMTLYDSGKENDEELPRQGTFMSDTAVELWTVI
jgi:hypothetical protein